MILLHVNLSTPVFIIILIGVAMIFTFVGSALGSSYTNPTQQDIEDGKEFEEWKKTFKLR